MELEVEAEEEAHNLMTHMLASMEEILYESEEKVKGWVEEWAEKVEAR